MKFLPTLDLWDHGVNEAVHQGRLKLQPGQWVRCGQSRRSRIVKVTRHGTVWAVHPQTNSGVDSRQHKQWLAVVREQRIA